MNAPASLTPCEPGVAAETVVALGFDRRTFLTAFIQTCATARAEEIYDGLGGFMAGRDRTTGDLAAYIETCGLELLDGWADLMVRTHQDREPWAREAALRAARAYTGRLADLMDASGAGGRP